MLGAQPLWIQTDSVGRSKSPFWSEPRWRGAPHSMSAAIRSTSREVQFALDRLSDVCMAFKDARTADPLAPPRTV